MPLRGIRSTLIASSIATLRERGLYERYLKNLSEAHHVALASLVAGTWLPTDLACAHYDACDRLALSPSEATGNGAAVAARAYDTWLQTVKKLATGAGLTPWTVIGQYDRLFQRAFEGGAFRIERMGPKDAILTITHFPLARFAYFRSAYAGLQSAALSLFCTRSYMRPVPGTTTDESFALRAAWV